MASLEPAVVAFRATVPAGGRARVERRMVRPFRGRALVLASSAAACSAVRLTVGQTAQFAGDVPGDVFILPTFTVEGHAYTDAQIDRIMATADGLDAPITMADVAMLGSRAGLQWCALAIDAAVTGWCVALEVDNPTAADFELRALLIGGAFP